MFKGSNVSVIKRLIKWKKHYFEWKRAEVPSWQIGSIRTGFRYWMIDLHALYAYLAHREQVSSSQSYLLTFNAFSNHSILIHGIFPFSKSFDEGTCLNGRGPSRRFRASSWCELSRENDLGCDDWFTGSVYCLIYYS